MSALLNLSRATLDLLPDNVRRPDFDPKEVRPGVAHLGFGGFHRAHMARYTHDLMEIRPEAQGWGIIGVGLLAADQRIRDALKPQDALYTLVERQGADQSAVVVGSVCDVLYAGADPSAVMTTLDDPAIRIVSLTVTENGYCLNPSTKQLAHDHPAIVHDLDHPLRPLSAVGVLVEAYRRRRISGGRAFTALSCDNIQHNGVVLREAVLTMARWRDPALADWIADAAGFPSTMVDRITPVTTPAQISQFAEEFGVADQAPVFCERFRQWVVEDAFVQDRPEWEAAGAQFVSDVAPYEFMKLRLLNASHLAIAGLGRLAGYAFIDETVQDPLIRSYMRALMDRETGPTLPPLPDVDLNAYKSELFDRFANVRIKDTVDRVNADAPINLLLDPLRDRLASGAGVDLLALALAAWMRRASGVDEEGGPISFVHPMAELLRSRAIAGGKDPRPLLALTQIFGDLGQAASLVDALEAWLAALYGGGVKATLADARRRLEF